MTCRKNQPNRTLLRTGLPALFLFFFVVYPFPAQAIYRVCSPITMQQAYAQGDRVFLGELVEIVAIPRKEDQGGRYADIWPEKLRLKFAVEKIWRGGVPNPATFVTFPPGPGPGGFEWWVGHQYVVLVYKDEFNEDQIRMMTAGIPCFASQQIFWRNGWHRKWDILYLDLLTNKTGVEKVLRGARRRTVQPWMNLERIPSTSSEIFFQPKELKSFFHILFEGLKEWNQVEEYGRLAEVLALVVQRDERVASVLHEMFQDGAALKPEAKGDLKHQKRVMLVLALALLESGSEPIQNQAATLLSKPIPWEDYWARWRAEYSLKEVAIKIP